MNFQLIFFIWKFDGLFRTMRHSNEFFIFLFIFCSFCVLLLLVVWMVGKFVAEEEEEKLRFFYLLLHFLGIQTDHFYCSFSGF